MGCAQMDHSFKRWWAGRSRLEKLGTAVAALTVGGAVATVLVPEIALAAAGGAVTAAAAWVVRKGVVG
jgi:hypothetical protein